MTNREKYMKQIYALIPNEVLQQYIGIDKNTNEVIACSDMENSFENCDKCICDKGGYCDQVKIIQWLDQEAPDDL